MHLEKRLQKIDWRPDEVEPATPRLGGGCSIQLSYRGTLPIISENFMDHEPS